jgi:methyl-galactoside transport system substrate-binding protein
MKNKIFAMSVVGMMSLASCSSTKAVAQLFLYDATDPFIQSLSKSLLSDIDGFLSYNTYDAARKQTTQNEDFLKSLDDSNTKILIMNIVDRLASSALIEKAEESNVPLVFINREPLAKDLTTDDWAKTNCYYCGSDPKYEGELQAEIVASLFGPAASYKGSKWDKNGDGKVQVAILKGELGHQDSEYRTEFCVSTLQSLGFDVDIIDTQYCNWERAKAYDAMKTMYDPAAPEPIELLFSNNDEMALGAIQYLEDTYVNPHSPSSSSSSESSIASSNTSEAIPFSERFFPIVGVDATADGRAAVQTGTLAGTVLNNASLQAEVITAIVRYLLFKEEIPSFGDQVETPNLDNQNEGNSYKVKGEKVTKNT